MVDLKSKVARLNRLLVAEWANDCQDLLELQTYVFKTSFTTKKKCSKFDLKRHCLVQFLTSIWICVSVNSQLQKNDVFHEEWKWHFSHFQILCQKQANLYSSTLTSSFKRQVISIHLQPQGNKTVCTEYRVTTPLRCKRGFFVLSVGFDHWNPLQSFKVTGLKLTQFKSNDHSDCFHWRTTSCLGMCMC